MKLIINTSTLSGTGVVQVAISFINECKKNDENEYHVFLSKRVSEFLNTNDFPDNFYFYKFENHPLYGIKGLKVRKKLRRLDDLIKADCIFTVFGPACWTPKTKHITGFANSYYVYPESPFFDIISPFNKIHIKILKIAHRYFLKRNGQFFICETEDMSNRLSNFLSIPKSNVFTVNNTYSHYFETPIKKNNILKDKKENEYRLLMLTSFAIHKNTTIINKIIPILNSYETNMNFKFILTIDNYSYEKFFSDEAKKHCINLGRIHPEDCPQLYRESDVLFSPTLIESFTANYPEAMVMKRPILTSNLPFATSICKDAALYFNPIDPNDIVDKIIEIANNRLLYKELVEKGSERVKVFGTAQSRAELYLKTIKLIINLN